MGLSQDNRTGQDKAARKEIYSSFTWGVEDGMVERVKNQFGSKFLMA
jgi:hypothetical protein